MRKQAAIVLNAPYLDVEIKEKDIICADGGRNLVVGSLLPQAIVGDLDSLGFYEPNGEEYVTCPVIKDYTDGERAIEYAKEKGYDEIIIYGAKGGRSDHVYANLSLLAFARETGLDAKIVSKGERIFYIKEGDGKINLDVKEGDIISVLSFKDEVTVTDSNGLFYPYNALTLTRTRALGISNVVVSTPASFVIERGDAFVFIITPEERDNR